MKTKLFALFVTLLFALSAVGVVAQDVTDSADRVDITGVDLVDSDVVDTEVDTDAVEVDAEPAVDVEPTISPMERLRRERLAQRTDRTTLLTETEKRQMARHQALATQRDRAEALGDRLKDIRAHQLERLGKAIEICKERGLEDCEVRFQERRDLIVKLTEQDLAHLKRVEHRRLALAGELNDLRDRKHFKKFNKDFKARDIAQDRMKAARERYQQAHDKASAAKERHEELRAKIQERREQLAACKEDDSQECQDLRDETRADAKEMLLKITERAEAALEKVLGKTAENEHLSDEEAERITTAVQENLDKLADIKTKIDALSEDAPAEDFRALASELKLLVKDSVSKAKRHAGHVVSARIGGVIVKAKHLEAKLESMLTRLVEHGVDTSSVEGKVDSFSEALSAAQESYEQAVEAYQAGNGGEAHEYMRAAHTSLKEAHSQLKEIFSELRELRKDADIGDGDVVDVEAAVDEALESEEDAEDESEDEVEEESEDETEESEEDAEDDESDTSEDQ